jgi:hypothetical protein
MQDARISRGITDGTRLAPFVIDLPLSVLRSMYLAPFTGENIDELPEVTMIKSLFELLLPFLVCLVTDMPLRSVYPDEDVQYIRPLLRNAFQD